VGIPNFEFRISNFACALYTFSVDDFLTPPLARWDGLHLVLDLDRLGRLANHFLRDSGKLRDLEFEGRGDALSASLTVVWKGVPARVGLDLAEIRLRHRHLGFRMRRVRGPAGLRVPRAAVELRLRSLDNPLLTVFPGQGIVVVDLRRWIPEEAELKILTVQATARSLSVWFGPGSLTDLPMRGPRPLPAGEPIE
jgi:hypothetical protein